MVSYETVTPVMATGETCANDVREVAGKPVQATVEEIKTCYQLCLEIQDRGSTWQAG